MAIKHLAIIRQRLFDGGRHRNEAVAVVSNATLAEEGVLETTLGRCVEDVASSNIEPPAMVVVGEVVRLRDGLGWAGALGGKLLAADPLGTRSSRSRINFASDRTSPLPLPATHRIILMGGREG